eukprot:g25115.t1
MWNELLQEVVERKEENTPLSTEAERVKSIKFLISHGDGMVKKAQRRLFFLGPLRKFAMSIRSLTNFYRCTTESKLPGCITAWYGNCSAQDRKKLQKV